MKKIALVILCLFAAVTAYAEPPASEWDLESAFIFHFINFTEWSDRQPDYYVCIPDDDNLLAAAHESLDGKMVNGRKIVVLAHSEACHVLVSENVPSMSKTTLTIGPLDKGALLEFRVVDNKLKFAVNLEKLKKAKLKISSQLLKLAILPGGY